MDDALQTSQSEELNFYLHKGVQKLLDNVRLEGWEEGFEQGHNVGKQKKQDETCTLDQPPSLNFTFFIENASGSNIHKFLEAAALTSEGRNLRLLFWQAF